ncbi:aldo/keto reductase [Actinocrispum sp. NPDC049592]|uniref:aldo/keto reductase n=1 Tax=Actinocrispum sp. NPDC049592 TaxID=3154835 RepID=UPI0034336E45
MNGDFLRGARLGFGAMQLAGPGAWGPPRDRDTALAVLRRAVELGVEHIDTSDLYGPAVANELIREALWPYPETLTIATKIGAVRGGNGSFDPAAKPAQLGEQVAVNRARLGVDQLDLVYLRTSGDGLLAADETPFEESFEALAELRRDGVIRNLGLSGVTVRQLELAQRMTPIAAVQNRFNLFDRAAADVLAECERQGIAFVPYFPLAAGMFKADRPPLPFSGTDQQDKVIATIADRHGASPAQIALAWLLARSPVMLPIPGTSSLTHLEENMAAKDIELAADEIAELDALAG